MGADGDLAEERTMNQESLRLRLVGRSFDEHALPLERYIQEQQGCVDIRLLVAFSSTVKDPDAGVA